MTAPAAPLEKAVEALRRALDGAYGESNLPWRVIPLQDVEIRSLLAALDADQWWSVWQKTYERQRKAEDALEEIRDSPTAVGKDIARRYFARREGEKGENRG